MNRFYARIDMLNSGVFYVIDTFLAAFGKCNIGTCPNVSALPFGVTSYLKFAEGEMKTERACLALRSRQARPPN
jgi:hypothetical protein